MILQTMKEKVPDPVLQIMMLLKDEGFEAYLVGGCVRDLLLGRAPLDFDITTSARPDQVEILFKDTESVGKRFGTILVKMGGYGVEVTSMRRESNYADGRRPEIVVFSQSLFEDLRRRDFTMNALAYDGGVLYDLFQGLQDIRLETIRTAGDPNERFQEDGLRLLRAVRFSCQLQFDIHPKTMKSIYSNAANMQRVAHERVKAELDMILLSREPGHGAFLLAKTGLMQQMDLMNGGKENGKNREYWHSLDRLDPDPASRWALFFFLIQAHKARKKKGDHDKSREPLEGWLSVYGFSKSLSAKIQTLTRETEYLPYRTEEDLRWAIHRLGKRQILQSLPFLSEVAHLSGVDPERIHTWPMSIKGVLSRKEPTAVSELALSGKDLLEAGFLQGPSLGVILNELLHEVIRDPKLNTKEKLFEQVKNYQE